MTNNKSIAQKIIQLRDKDINLREELLKKGTLFDGYNKEMEALHNSNAKALNQIIETVGYPTPGKVGKKASQAAWLIIQHAIGQPDFMKKCAALLKRAVDEKKASPVDLAYLTDRIAVFEGKPQRYGTQFDWDENGQISPSPYDNLEKVNDRRISIGLNTLEEQIKIVRKISKNEKQVPPPDMKERKQKYDAWRKSVGWIQR